MFLKNFEDKKNSQVIKKHFLPFFLENFIVLIQTNEKQILTSKNNNNQPSNSLAGCEKGNLNKILKISYFKSLFRRDYRKINLPKNYGILYIFLGF